VSNKVHAQPVTEKQWQAQVVQLLETYNYLVYHTYDSRRSKPGFPDLVAVGKQVFFLECKTERGKVTSEQQEWIDGLRSAGANVAVITPRDWDALERTVRQNAPERPCTPDPGASEPAGGSTTAPCKQPHMSAAEYRRREGLG
jgi:hypothetical protein